jgi:hypothetical protein
VAAQAAAGGEARRAPAQHLGQLVRLAEVPRLGRLDRVLQQVLARDVLGAGGALLRHALRLRQPVGLQLLLVRGEPAGGERAGAVWVQRRGSQCMQRAREGWGGAAQHQRRRGGVGS